MDAALLFVALELHPTELCDISNNTFYGTDRKASFTWWTNGNQRLTRIKSSKLKRLDNNRYVQHYSTSNLFYGTVGYSNFSGWKTEVKGDANSSFDNEPLKTGETEKLFYNDTKKTKAIDLGASVYKDLDGKQISGNLSLEPFTSKILIKTTLGAPPVSNKSPEILDQSFEITTIKSVNDLIGQIIASDPDAGQQLTYSVVQGNDEGLFAINPETGKITANTILNLAINQSVTLNIQVTDNAESPLSASAIVTINLNKTIPDVGSTPPTIASFSIPASSTSLTIPVSTFTVTNGDAVAGYTITDCPEVPLDTDNTWTASVPEGYTCSQAGSQTLYAWAKDAAGNISASLNASVMITLPVPASNFSEYLFEEGPGATAIDSRGQHDGTILNEESRVDGLNGKGLAFSGSGYVNLGNCFGDNVQDQLTLSAWLKPEPGTGGYQGVIMHGGPNVDTYAIYIHPEQKSISFKTSGTTSPWNTIGNIDKLWDGNWHHLAVTYDGEKKTFYLDDDILTTVDASGTIQSGEGYNLLIGTGRDQVPTSLLYRGSIDEVRIYNTALNNDEIADLYKLVKDGAPVVNHSPEIGDQYFEVTKAQDKNDPIGQITATDANLDQELSYEIIEGNEEGLFSVDPATGLIVANKTISAANNTAIVVTVKVSDNATEPLQASADVTIDIKISDTTLPTIASFIIPASSTLLTVPISVFTATDDIAVAGYMLTDCIEAPLATDSAWTASAPESYTCLQYGSQTLYAWAKDAAGNISASTPASVTITLPVPATNFSEYLFEEGAGATAIDSQGQNDGTILNEESRVDGLNGKGLAFTGSGYVNLGNCFGGNVLDQLTLSAWLKPEPGTGGYQGVIMHGGPNVDTYALYIHPGQKSISFKTSGTTSPWNTIGNIDKLWDGNWHHLAVTYDGEKKTFYLDDDILTTVDADGTIQSGEGYNLLIGAGRDQTPTSLLYKGAIDEVRIYNTALSNAEIVDLYKMAKDGQPVVNSSPEIEDQYFEVTKAKNINELLGQITASDPDATQTLGYAIIGGNEEGLFAVDPVTGEIFANKIIGAANDQTIVLEVEVTDNSPEPLSASADVTINITVTDFSEYLFEEHSGPIAIDSQGQNDGTVLNEELRVEGVSGNGLKFTGSGYINLGNCFGDNVRDQLTLSTWVRPEPGTGGYQGVIMHGGPNVDTYALYIHPGQKSISFKTSGTTSSWTSISNIHELWDGNWHHLSVTYDGEQKVIYLDDVVLATVGASGIIESGEGYNLLIGTGRDQTPASLLYKGLIDEARIYNRALSGTEISALYNLAKEGALAANQSQDVSGNTIFFNSGISTGNDLLEILDASIYPNPTNGIFTVRANNLTSENCEITLFSMTGNLVTKKQLSATFGSLEERLDMSHLSNGTYIVRLVSEGQTYQSKIIII
jgi:hypothetical protein